MEEPDEEKIDEEVDEDIDKEEEEQPIINIKREVKKHSRQIILKKLARSCEQLGRGFFFTYDVVKTLLARQGDDGINALKKAWGDKFEENIQRLTRLGSIVADLTYHLLLADDLKFLKEESLSNPLFQQYRSLFIEATQYMDVLYESFFALMDNTKVTQFLDIPHEYLSERKEEKES